MMIDLPAQALVSLPYIAAMIFPFVLLRASFFCFPTNESIGFLDLRPCSPMIWPAVQRSIVTVTSRPPRSNAKRNSLSSNMLFQCGIVCAPERRLPFAARASVVGLLDRSGPAAVARFIVTIVVDTVNRRPRRTFTHVLDEHGEVAPPLADRDAATAVLSELRVTRPLTPSAHVRPEPEEWVLFRSRGQPVLRGSRCDRRSRSLALPAAARRRTPLVEMSRLDRLLDAAVALTPPQEALGLSLGPAQMLDD